jgi:hypothetical protein
LHIDKIEKTGRGAANFLDSGFEKLKISKKMKVSLPAGRCSKPEALSKKKKRKKAEKGMSQLQKRIALIEESRDLLNLKHKNKGYFNREHTRNSSIVSKKNEGNFLKNVLENSKKVNYNF